jgi:hypothetical protein
MLHNLSIHNSHSCLILGGITGQTEWIKPEAAMTLQISPDTAQKSAWENNAELLDVLRDDSHDVVAFIEHCSADDLHCLTTVHGVIGEVEIFDAILRHPACDRATALQVFENCNPYYYEQELAKGRALDAYDDEEDQVFITIIDMAHAQLVKRLDWRGKFECPALRKWDRFPHSAPINFQNWMLPAAVLAPTEAVQPNAFIEYRYSSIRLTYQAWMMRQ